MAEPLPEPTIAVDVPLDISAMESPALETVVSPLEQPTTAQAVERLALWAAPIPPLPLRPPQAEAADERVHGPAAALRNGKASDNAADQAVAAVEASLANAVKAGEAALAAEERGNPNVDPQGRGGAP